MEPASIFILFRVNCVLVTQLIPPEQSINCFYKMLISTSLKIGTATIFFDVHILKNIRTNTIKMVAVPFYFPYFRNASNILPPLFPVHRPAVSHLHRATLPDYISFLSQTSGGRQRWL